MGIFLICEASGRILKDMKYNITKKGVELTNMDEASLTEKIDRLEKHLHEPYVVDIWLSRDTHHQSGDVITCRINVEEGKKVFHAERTAATILDAIDEVIAAVTQQLEKHHDRT